jgi:quinol monooxygenase YgiN
MTGSTYGLCVPAAVGVSAAVPHSNPKRSSKKIIMEIIMEKIMTMRSLISVACLFGLATSACAGSSEETGATGTTTPAAAAGDPAATAGGQQPVLTQAPPEPEPAPAASIAPPPAPMPMFGAAISHKVKDFDAWKTAFDADLDARKAAGFVAQGVMQGADDPKLVTIWLAVTDVEKAKAFFADKALKEKMKTAGVQGKPEIRIWSNVDAKMDPGKQGLSAAMVAIKLKDFAAFKTAFDAGSQARSDAGIVGYGLSQDVDDKSMAYLYLQSEDAAKLKTYVTAKETKQGWKDAGVKGAPMVNLVKEGEMTMYQ